MSASLVTALRFLGFDAHPVATGAEVCRRLRVTGGNTPVLFLSARDTVADKCHALAMGGDDCMTKPFDLTEVSARIRALIRRARAPATPRPRGPPGGYTSAGSNWTRRPGRCGGTASRCSSLRPSSPCWKSS
ncbi:response regulator [Streptomyces sp. NBC_01390]